MIRCENLRKSNKIFLHLCFLLTRNDSHVEVETAQKMKRQWRRLRDTFSLLDIALILIAIAIIIAVMVL